jgi:excisionase family DNA binding protein
MEMLNLGKSKVYELIRNNSIKHIKVGSKYIVPKNSVIALFGNLCYDSNQIINDRLQQEGA